MKHWKQTFSGVAYDLENPTPEMVVDVDIAHALAHINRFGGHGREFYCPTPEQRILTADLEWRPAGDLSVGDALFGFDEEPWEAGSSAHGRRRFRPCAVTHHEPMRRDLTRIELSDGSSLRCSAEHPWLVATKDSGNQSWLTTAGIAQRFREGRTTYMNRFMATWQAETSFAAGWLSGMFDGEGHVSFVGRGGVQCGVSQKVGPTLNSLVQELRGFGVPLTVSPTGGPNVRTAQIRGGAPEVLRTLGRFRPERLVRKISDGLLCGTFAKQLTGVERLRVTGVWDEGQGEVSGISTSTRTYLCEGFGAHNSVAEHCVLGAKALLGIPGYREDPALAALFLIHDAHEYVTGDMASPAKGLVCGWDEWERKHEHNLHAAVGIPSTGYSKLVVKHMDLRMLRAERDALLGTPPQSWAAAVESARSATVSIQCWTPKEARYQYAKMAQRLGLCVNGKPWTLPQEWVR